jgi:gliding motility-associated transport system permease protein
MKTVYVWQRELVSLFTSPVGYVAIAAMTVINSFFFWIILKAYPYATLQPLLGNMSITLLFFAPAFTMRALAEEKKSGTAELLFTAPLSDTQIVLGKYLGAFTLFAVAMVVSLMYPAFLMQFGEPDKGPLLAGYLGIILLGGAYLVVGLFVSSLTSSQIVAFIGSLGILLVFFFLQAVGQREFGWARDLLEKISLSSHYDDFAKGAIDLKNVAYYLMFIAFFLFATVRSVESRKWR